MSAMKRSSLVGIILVVGMVLYIGGPAQAQGFTKLRPETVSEFDAYVKDGERLLQKRIDGERPFLWVADLPERRLALRRGDILVEGLPETPTIEGGLLHVWLGAMFVPEATGPEVLAVLQDYDRHCSSFSLCLSMRFSPIQAEISTNILSIMPKTPVPTIYSSSTHTPASVVLKCLTSGQSARLSTSA